MINKLSKIISLLLLIIATSALHSCSSNTANSDSPVITYPQEFSTVGNRIVDETNQPVIFRGVSIECPIVLSHSLQDKATGGPLYFDQYLEWNESIFANMSDWGATIVRLPVYPAALRLHGETDALQIIDEAISWATKYKLYVILDFHSIGFPTTSEYDPNIAEGYGDLYATTPEDILSFWSTVSERYQNNRTVAFYELFNEPVYPSFATSEYAQSNEAWLGWKTFAEEIIDTIRTHDPNSTVIVGGLHWSYDLSYLSQPSNAVNRTNVIYAVHPYPGAWVVADSTVADWAITFGEVSANYPIFATEIGFLLDNPDETPYYEGLFTGDGLYRDAIKSYLVDRQISWTAWCFSPYTWPKLLQDKNYNSTVAGSFIHSWLQETN